MTPRPFDLNLRLIDFAITVSSLVQQIRDTHFGRHVGDQLIRCATAPAANHAEAQGAESRRDFIHKLRLALKELKETRTWLQLVRRKRVNTHGITHTLTSANN